MFFKKKNTVEVSDTDIVSVANGIIYPTSEIKDAVFAQEMLGKTMAIKPDDKPQTLVAPCNGTLSVLYPTGHAYGITMKDGTSVLIHVGIDTVNMKGKGFKILARQDDVVKAGDPIVKADFVTIDEAGYDTSIMTIITENPTGRIFEFKENAKVKATESILK